MKYSGRTKLTACTLFFAGAVLFSSAPTLAQSPYSYRDTPFDYTPPFQYYPSPATEPAAEPEKKISEEAPAAAVAAEGEMPRVGRSAEIAAGKTSYIEAGAFYHKLTDGFGHWRGLYAKGSTQTDAKNIWHAELQAASQFSDEGLLGTIGNTHFWNEDWYTIVTVGGGASDFYLPRFRIDGFVYKKWLEDKRLITYVGTGYSKAQEIFNDKHITVGGIYYWGGPWITEAGVRFNLSDPGSVSSRSHYAALTHHVDKDHTLTLRGAFGNESYQIIGGGSQIVDFDSHEAYLYYKNWLGDDWGYTSQIDGYDNPFYSRYGLRVGYFKEF